jgi:ribosomal protein S21
MHNYLEIESRNDIIEMALREFYKEMNRQAVQLKLKDTQFSSAHGMHHD